MKTKTNTELKNIAKMALKSEYGFTVSKLSDITLLEADGDGLYILFEVNGNEYKFNSYTMGIHGLWVGKGTITRTKDGSEI